MKILIQGSILRAMALPLSFLALHDHVYIEMKGGDQLFISQNPEMMAKIFAFFEITRRN